ncbi:MAG TPA: bifunctional riboflavin kinase/FAD synthetase [Solirubrobacteraceae bacterium]|nr:bifunctional riboflavin kinase/FAD synthetase [Solirubrobacteraceae bacterium]
MQITPLRDAEPLPGRSVAVGTFDGVHLGHREVIAGSDSVLTFEPHPLAVIAPDHVPRLLTTLERKAELVAQLGVRELVVIAFDHDFAQRSAESFIDEILVGKLGASEVAVGENFRFGNRARGDTEMLAAHAELTTTVHPLLEADGEVVSSSRIRGLVAAGEMAEANRLLGETFELTGTVIDGDRRGRELGFPTANIEPDGQLAVPAHGIYACLADGMPAAVSIGVRPTFGAGRSELIEVHVLDYDGDLYGRQLRVQFVARLRGERRFADTAALVEQMERDVADAAAALKAR